jgi:hypothetical protein
MAIYVPYIVGSTIVSLLGGISYNYYNIEEKGIEDKFNYDIIEEENRILGRTRNQKIEGIINVCKVNNINLSNVNRCKLKKYIKEYEEVGHDKFILNHKNESI